MMCEFSILITTKNRLEHLKFTLQKINHLLVREHVECIICDDGSNDGTSNYIIENYPDVLLIQHKKPLGLIASRNELLNLTQAKYAINLDDDAHILSNNPLEKIEDFFQSNPKCAVIAFRIFWSEKELQKTECDLKPKRVKGYVGCGHVWNMEAWRSIPDYPDWFVFYGEEDFASYQLFKNNWEVWFLPSVLVHHRVNIKNRRHLKDYTIRLRRSLRSGWYLYFLFFPIKKIPKKLAYTLWVQIKIKIFKSDFRVFLAISRAIFDVVTNMPKLVTQRNALTNVEYQEFMVLPDTIIYWEPFK